MDIREWAGEIERRSQIVEQEQLVAQVKELIGIAFMCIEELEPPFNRISFREILRFLLLDLDCGEEE